MSYVFAPVAVETLVATSDDDAIGGLLIALLKDRAGAICPILISDEVRLLVGNAMMQSVSTTLSAYFLSAHPRVIRGRCASAGRGIQGFHSIRSLLPSFPPCHVPSQLDTSNPVALVLLDAVNAYNKMGQVPIFDTVVGAVPGIQLRAGWGAGNSQCLQPLLPFFKQYYGTPAVPSYQRWAR